MMAIRSGSSPNWTFGWTPPGGAFLSAIGMMEAPREPLSHRRYKMALMGRYDRMVAATPPARANRLLRVAYDREGLDVDGRLSGAAELLVENSSALGELLPYWFEPLPVDQLVHEPKTLRRLLERPMGLAVLLNQIYSPVPCWNA